MASKNQSMFIKILNRLLMVGSAVALLLVFVFPLWRIDLKAPQYPESLGMYIYINKLKGVKKNDLKSIDILNHYVGMKPLPKPDEMWEFKVFPIVVGGMAVLALVLAIVGNPVLYAGWALLMVIFGALGLYDFYLWLYDYGTNLDPNAPIKLVDEHGNPLKYIPPLIGRKQLLNFTVTSYPVTGGILVAVSILLALAAFYVCMRYRARAKPERIVEAGSGEAVLSGETAKSAVPAC